MKKIILVRHGKSAWNNSELTDHDRPLATRGLNDVPMMALRLKEKGLTPDLIITSSAIRATQTSSLLAEVLNLPKSKIVYDKTLYHASFTQIVKCIQKQDDANELIFLVGHNPGMNDFIAFFGGNFDNLPTSGHYGFEMEEDQWMQFRPENVKFWFFDYPKKER